MYYDVIEDGGKSHLLFCNSNKEIIQYMTCKEEGHSVNNLRKLVNNQYETLTLNMLKCMRDPRLRFSCLLLNS